MQLLSLLSPRVRKSGANFSHLLPPSPSPSSSLSSSNHSQPCPSPPCPPPLSCSPSLPPSTSRPPPHRPNSNPSVPLSPPSSTLDTPPSLPHHPPLPTRTLPEPRAAPAPLPELRAAKAAAARRRRSFLHPSTNGLHPRPRRAGGPWATQTICTTSRGQRSAGLRRSTTTLPSTILRPFVVRLVGFFSFFLFLVSWPASMTDSRSHLAHSHQRHYPDDEAQQLARSPPRLDFHPPSQLFHLRRLGRVPLALSLVRRLRRLSPLLLLPLCRSSRRVDVPPPTFTTAHPPRSRLSRRRRRVETRADTSRPPPPSRPPPHDAPLFAPLPHSRAFADAPPETQASERLNRRPSLPFLPFLPHFGRRQDAPYAAAHPRRGREGLGVGG